jgi:hypothetical protein
VTLRPCPKPAPRPKKAPKRIRSTGKSRFPRRRDPEYLAWIRTLPCIVPTHTGFAAACGPVADRHKVEAAHVKTRGSGGDDRKNTLPCCPRHHDEQEGRNTSFELKYGIGLKTLALAYDITYSRIGGNTP